MRQKALVWSFAEAWQSDAAFFKIPGARYRCNSTIYLPLEVTVATPALGNLETTLVCDTAV